MEAEGRRAALERKPTPDFGLNAVERNLLAARHEVIAALQDKFGIESLQPVPRPVGGPLARWEQSDPAFLGFTSTVKSARIVLKRVLTFEAAT